MMLTASIVTIAAVALAYQLTLPQIWSGFQIVGDGDGKYDFAANAVLLGTVLIIFTTAVNAFGVKLMAQINSAGVAIELVAAVLLVIAFFIAAKRGPDVVLETQGRGDGRRLGYLGAFLAASIASPYVMYGFDTASSLGEETRRPAPQRAEGDPPRADRVVRHRRPDPARRDDGRRQHQRRGAEHGRPAVRRPRRLRRAPSASSS